MVNPTQSWYILKQPEGHCDIVPELPQILKSTDGDKSSVLKTWGPFPTQGEAIAKRIGLIRAGQCRPL